MKEHPPFQLANNTITDPHILAVITRLDSTRTFPAQGSREAMITDPAAFAEHGFSIHPAQGELIYLLCRAMRATRVVDFATSIGMSALYFAAAMKETGGQVIGAELVPEKAEVARRNLAEAGLADYADIRSGDARHTLKDLGGPVDFVLIDGWPGNSGHSLAYEVLQVVAPQLRVGGYVLNDNAEPDFISYIRNPANSFISVSLPIKGSTELAVKVF
ncbi:methyltransferase [Chimaeribacter californicus]|uniref:Methyltransferase n=1 Tax=Chimaeribacter californicus TaxID=2060067 RepID=A0A2N5E7A9_9GAMM|nr:class I SAM-dependent methyltransferase [Chimaeribacter californicus]PLR37373.1 methyltransferase [Chimaeribacter californicus]